ncbi:MAG TPA: zinc-binding alcohol dehydrogenase [Armatimonadetes bacterium]|nr:zinc-binding alcohol dehydrogenase [Armatimonadota bacterium]
MKTFSLFIDAPFEARLREEELPQIGPGMFLTRTITTAISTGTEMTAYTGDFPKRSKWAQYVKYPFRAGYSNLGEVVEVGKGVEGVRVGDRVVGYKPHSQFAVYREGEFFVKVPEGIPDEVAPTFSIAVITLNGVRRAGLNLGECAVVYGLGPLGLFTLQFARLDGARPVIGVDISEHRRRLAEKAGADLTIDGRDPNLVDKVRRATKGRMADVVFEVTGSPEVIPEEFKVLREQGRMVLLSSPRGITPFDFHDLCNAPSFTIIGAHNLSHPPHETPQNPWTMRRNCELFFDLVLGGEFKVAELITHKLPWHEAPKAYKMLERERGKTGFVILDWRG